MNAAMTDGRLQVTAAAALLGNSGLVEWIPELCEFVPVTREVFESSWQRDVDPVFGRVICWISFAAGAEFLAKGTCLVRGVDPEGKGSARLPYHRHRTVGAKISEGLEIRRYSHGDSL